MKKMIRTFLMLFMVGVVTGAATVVPAEAAKKKDAPAKAKKKRAPKGNSAMGKIEDVQGLPRVLLIGDSISIGYTVATRTLLKGKINLHRIPANGGPTTRGLSEIDKWLGDKKWDVIHFNWGLHDLKYMGSKGENLADPKDPANKQQVQPAEYATNLLKLVERLKKTKAKLIWATTTPVAEGTKGRVHGHSAAYNKIARKIMDEHKIAIDDLYTLALRRLDEIQLPKNVHFKPEGSKVLAGQVANSILKALGKPELPKPKRKPAATGKIKTGWSDAKVGMMVKYKSPSNMTITHDVIKVTDDTVTVQVTAAMPTMPAPMVRTQDYPRYGKPGPDGKPPEQKGKKVGKETLTVSGKQLKCEIWETAIEADGKTITSKVYICKDVPRWVVRAETGIMGAMVTVMELVEFKD